MPLYEYACAKGHLWAELRSFYDRSDPTTCPDCGQAGEAVISLPAKRTDGIYSYAPNTGDPRAHERKQAKVRGEIPLGEE